MAYLAFRASSKVCTSRLPNERSRVIAGTCSKSGRVLLGFSVVDRLRAHFHQATEILGAQPRRLRIEWIPLDVMILIDRAAPGRRADTRSRTCGALHDRRNRKVCPIVDTRHSDVGFVDDYPFIKCSTQTIRSDGSVRGNRG